MAMAKCEVCLKEVSGETCKGSTVIKLRQLKKCPGLIERALAKQGVTREQYLAEMEIKSKAVDVVFLCPECAPLAAERSGAGGKKWWQFWK